MQAEYKRDLHHNYLILEVPEESAREDYSLVMAEQNEIPGLLPFHSAGKDGNLYLHYEITSKQPLESLYGKRLLGSQELIFLLSSVLEVLNELQKYLLIPKQLIFDPQYVYVGSDRKRVEFCYLPGEKEERQIELFAEFLLKRLDHEDRQAVELGYQFYQKTLEENFSLKKTLKEILSGLRGLDHPEKEKRERGAAAGAGTWEYGSQGEHLAGKWTEDRNADRNRMRKDGSGPEDGRTDSDARGTGLRKGGADDWNAGRMQTNRGRNTERSAEKKKNKSGTGKNADEYHVMHVTRTKKSSSKGKLDRLFQAVHPAVLLSGLFLLAALEIVYYFGFVTLTEAGGLFFLVISAEILVNQFWKRKQDEKDQNRSQWIEQEESEMYEMLREEMYQVPEEEPEIEETRCLAEPSVKSGIRLICTQQSGHGAGTYPDIFIEKGTVLVGKRKEEAEVILPSPTVSRLHAQLKGENGRYYVCDLNSKNGTFCNGDRLVPQEQRQFAAGDRISFAEIEYLAVH